MSVKDIFEAAFNKDASSFETAFSSVMKEKVIAAVENKFFAVEEYELEESKYEDDEEEDEDEDEEELDESWSDGVSSRNADMHARTASQYRKKANDAAAMAKNYEKGSLGHSKNMAAHHSAMAKSIKSSYHAGDYGSVNTAKRDHSAQMAKAKEYKSSMSEEFEELDELSTNTLKSYRTAAWKDAGKAYKTSDSSRKSDSERYAAHKRGDKRMAGYELATAKTGLKPNKTYQDSGVGSIPNAKIKSTKEEVEEFELDEAAKKDWDYTDEALALLKKAEDAGIKVIRKDKYVKGMKALGPRMPRKANVEALTRALQALKNGDSVRPVEYWVG